MLSSFGVVQIHPLFGIEYGENPPPDANKIGIENHICISFSPGIISQ